MHSFGTSLATILNKVGTILARQVASDLDAISNTFLKERAELLEAMQSVAARTKDGLSYLLSLVASQNALAALQELAIGNISGAVKKYFKPEDSQYEANWGALSVNASIHVPQDLLQAASLPIAFYGGKTLQPGSWPQCILQVSRSLLREFFDPDVFASLRTAPANISQSLKYNAWLFIMPQSRPQIIRFDGRIREPDMRQHALYVLASDTLGHTFSLMLLTSEDNYEFKLVYGGQTFTFNRETNLQVTKQLYWKRDPIESPMNIRNQNTWLLTGTSAQITFVYDMFRHVLWMQFGTKWHGRLNGLFGSTTAVNFNRNYHVPMDHSWTAQEKPSWKTWEYRDRFDVHFHSWIRNNQVDEQIVAEWFAHYTSCNRRIDITPFLKISSQKKDSRNRQQACSALAGYLYACEGTKEDAFFDHNCGTHLL
ncbi:unnamed protein product [Schistocephalus solidus]|uniref:Apolipophorin n=1 Tax=Schistocephalus solidus TaxID=70667 RepID=A0A183TL71_SCHSO|nr:unnamed protein product [Schistocephalus solidus]